MVAGLDLFYLFVENVFGGVLISALGFIGLFILIGIASKMSVQSLVLLIGLFIMTFAVGYIGGLAVLIFGILALVYAFQGFINFINAGRT